MDPNIKLVYLYFDYKLQQTQTCTQIARTLLKQLLSKTDSIPRKITAFYELCITKSLEPDIDTLIQHLISFSQTFTVYSIFDAMDECSDTSRSAILSLFHNLQKSKYRLLVSMRPHLVLNFRDHINDVELFQVSAEPADLTNYIKFRLRKAKNTNSALEERCLDLRENVDGM